MIGSRGWQIQKDGVQCASEEEQEEEDWGQEGRIAPWQGHMNLLAALFQGTTQPK
jgi:hypothetical protein